MEDTLTTNSQSRTLPFEFHGKGGEYFKIWIVNILLTIVSLGIYSAWATVRSNRYFYSNLELDGSRFRYLAEPMTILKGRLIAVAAFIVYTLISSLSSTLGFVLAIALFIAIPYFINQSITFGNRMTAYKNIQFRFKGNYGEAFMVFYVWPILGILTLGVLYPMAILKLNKYVVKNSSYGTSSFEFNATYSDYGKIFLMALGAIVILAIAGAVMVAVVPLAIPVLSVVLLVGYIAVVVALTNLYYCSVSLVDHGFTANLSTGGFAKMMLINTFFTIITLGLYLPAAKVRMTQYICSCIVMNSQGSLDNFASAEQENISALGEELGQVFDFGF